MLANLMYNVSSLREYLEGSYLQNRNCNMFFSEFMSMKMTHPLKALQRYIAFDPKIIHTTFIFLPKNFLITNKKKVLQGTEFKS